MSPELLDIPESLPRSSLSNSFSLILSTSPFLHQPHTIWYSRETVLPILPSLPSFFYSNPSLFLSPSLAPAMFRRTIETNRSIRSKCPVIAIERHNRLFLLSSLLSFLFFSLRDPSNWLLLGVSSMRMKEPNSKERVPTASATFRPFRLAVKHTLAWIF